jgi:hypothetical protein
MLIDELANDYNQTGQENFLVNRACLLEAYCEKRLYGLTVEETEEMFQNGSGADEIFGRDRGNAASDYILPCFCVVCEVDPNAALMV